MAKKGVLALISVVLLISGIGYISQLIKNPVDMNLSILFMLELLIIYIILKQVRIE